MVCKICGAELPDGAVKCPECDAEIVVENEEAAVVEEIVFDVEENAEVLEKKPKVKGWVWVVAAAAIAVIAACAFFISSNLVYTTAKSDDVSISVVTKKNNEKVYAKVGNKELVLIKELGENETFTDGKEFIIKNNNIYFLDDEGGLTIMNMKNGKSAVIGDDFLAGTMVISAKGDVVLYAGEDGVLYKTVKGKKAKPVAEIGSSTFPTGMPNYGFVEETNTVWYAPIEGENAVGSVYLENGDKILDDAATVFHCGDKGETIVYLAVTSENVVQPELPEDAEEGQEMPEPVVERTFGLAISEQGKEPEILYDNFATTDTVIILNKEHKGVVYIADKQAPAEDDQTGVAPGTLYLREFGGEKIALEEGVTVALLVDELNGSNYYHNASDRAENETIAYMKENTISLLRDLKKVENPKDFEFLSSTPMFAKNNTFMLYKTFVPVAVEETEEEEKQVVANPSKLVYTTLENGVWSDYVEIAENVMDYKYDENKNKIYYLVDEAGDTTKLVLFSYDVAAATSSKIAEDVLGYVTIADKGKNVYYIHNYDADSLVAKMSLFTGKESVLVAEKLTGCLLAQDGTPYLIVKKDDKNDMYRINGTNVTAVCQNMTDVLYIR